MRYGLWTVVAILLVVAAVFFVKGIIEGKAQLVPGGYAYSIVDEHSGTGVVTYYVYDGKIYTVTEDNGNTQILIFDNVDTASIKYDESATKEVCDKKECWRQVKALDTIKQMLAHKAGREYNGS